MATSDTNLPQLIIHELTKEQYEALTPEPNQLYLTPDESLIAGDLKTINGNSIVGSGDIGVGTVTSVNNISPVNGNVTIEIPDSATWGNITGTLSNQTDLKNALDGKYDASNPNNYTSVVESTVSGWGFTKNTGTVISVNNVSPVNGNVTVNSLLIRDYTAS